MAMIAQPQTEQQPRIPNAAITFYANLVHERQEREARAALREEPLHAFPTMFEVVSLRVAELAADVAQGRWDDAEQRIVADGIERDFSRIRDEHERRQSLLATGMYHPSGLTFDPDFARKLKEQLDLAEFLTHRSWVSLKRSGARYVGRCPFHDDKSPSFTVSKGLWHCFGCGDGGDVYTFIQRATGCGFFDAVRTVAGYLNVSMSAPIYEPSNVKSFSSSSLPPIRDENDEKLKSPPKAPVTAIDRRSAARARRMGVA